MDYYLHQNGEQSGPFTEDQIRSMLECGAVDPTDIIWHEGLSEWQPIETVLSLPIDPQAVPPATTPKAPQTVLTNVKQGALIGGWVCFGLGLVFMFVSLFFVFLYGPLFLVAFILSIVAMAQRRIWGGVALLLATLILPTVLWFALFATRTVDFLEKQTADASATKAEASSKENPPVNVADALKQGFEEAAKKQDLERLQTLRAEKAQYEKQVEELRAFEVLNASFRRDKDAFAGGKAVIELTIKNNTAFPVKRAYFRGVISSAGRSVPWIDDSFNYEVAGGVEPDEQVTWQLAPNMFSDWGKADPPPDASFKVEVTRLDGADGEPLFGKANFSKEDQERLDALEKQYGSTPQ